MAHELDPQALRQAKAMEQELTEGYPCDQRANPAVVAQFYCHLMEVRELDAIYSQLRSMEESRRG